MSFERAFEIVVGLEGGYGFDEHDPGGETKFGISRRAYPNEDISALTVERAKEIYRADYWRPIHGNELPWPLALFVFDAAVNQGVDPAIRLLQQVLQVAVDGKIGPQTIAAAKRATPEHAALYLADRAIRYSKTPGFPRYGRGWIKRLMLNAMEG